MLGQSSLLFPFLLQLEAFRRSQSFTVVCTFYPLREALHSLLSKTRRAMALTIPMSNCPGEWLSSNEFPDSCSATVTQPCCLHRNQERQCQPKSKGT